jgi:hypothetical protein
MALRLPGGHELVAWENLRRVLATITTISTKRQTHAIIGENAL